MRDDKPTPVRLDDELRERAKNAAQKMGLHSRGAIIKLCLETFLDDFEKRGMAALPLDWRSILESRDGRRAPLLVAEANGHNSTVIINHGHGSKSHYTKSKPKKRKGEK